MSQTETVVSRRTGFHSGAATPCADADRPRSTVAGGRTPLAWLVWGAANREVEDPDSRTLLLPSGLDAIRTGREFARSTLVDWDLVELREDVTLVVSELVTNAIRYGLPSSGPGAVRASSERPIRLRLVWAEPHLLCLVTDPSSEIPVRRESDLTTEGGRGLHVIESLCRTWGWLPLVTGGKAVWALFRDPFAPLYP